MKRRTRRTKIRQMASPTPDGTLCKSAKSPRSETYSSETVREFLFLAIGFVWYNLDVAKRKSPLKWRTPERWADGVLEDPLALLSDHAYLERKAASNALELLNRWPDPGCPPNWVRVIAGVARDEALHLDQVLKHLARRGGKL